MAASHDHSIFVDGCAAADEIAALTARLQAAVRALVAAPEAAVRERVAGLLEDRARLYQRDDGEAGPLGFNQWGWRAIAEILRKEAAALRAVQGGE